MQCPVCADSLSLVTVTVSYLSIYNLDFRSQSHCKQMYTIFNFMFIKRTGRYIILYYIHYKIYLHPSAVGSEPFQIGEGGYEIGNLIGPGLPLVSAMSHQLSREREEGEKSGSGAWVVHSTFKAPLPCPLCDSPSAHPHHQAHDPSQPKTPALLMWFLCCSHICHSSTVFFYFTYLRLSRL